MKASINLIKRLSIFIHFCILNLINFLKKLSKPLLKINQNKKIK